MKKIVIIIFYFICTESNLWGQVQIVLDSLTIGNLIHVQYVDDGESYTYISEYTKPSLVFYMTFSQPINNSISLICSFKYGDKVYCQTIFPICRDEKEHIYVALEPNFFDHILYVPMIDGKYDYTQKVLSILGTLNVYMTIKHNIIISNIAKPKKIIIEME